MYGSKDISSLMDIDVKAEDITLPNYTSIFKGFSDQ